MFFSTTPNATTSPLVCLPAELRNKTFIYVFCNKTVILSAKRWEYQSVDPSRPHDIIVATSSECQRFVAPALICKQIHTETYTLPYELSEIFVIDGGAESMINNMEQTRRDAIKDVTWLHEELVLADVPGGFESDVQLYRQALTRGAVDEAASAGTRRLH